MNIQTIAEHKIDLDLLPEKGNILDLGCRNFIFANEMIRQGHKVLSVDCDELETDVPYYRYAIVGKIDGPVYVHRDVDPQATKVARKGLGKMVIPMTIKSFSDMFGMWGKWDLIKIDVEGMEKEIIENLDEPPAKQLSIEFHIHTNAYTWDDVENMVYRLFVLGYVPVSHEITEQHGCGKNYWSSLFVLK